MEAQRAAQIKLYERPSIQQLDVKGVQFSRDYFVLFGDFGEYQIRVRGLFN